MIRLFDETLATKVAGAFAMPTISTSQVAAPAFIAAATGRKIYQGFQLAGQYVHLTDLTICPTGRLVGRTVGDIQSDKRINIVMHQGSSGGQRQPRPRDRAGARRHHPGHRPDGSPADARGDEPGQGMPCARDVRIQGCQSSAGWSVEGRRRRRWCSITTAAVGTSLDVTKRPRCNVDFFVMEADTDREIRLSRTFDEDCPRQIAIDQGSPEIEARFLARRIDVGGRLTELF